MTQDSLAKWNPEYLQETERGTFAGQIIMLDDFSWFILFFCLSLILVGSILDFVGKVHIFDAPAVCCVKNDVHVLLLTWSCSQSVYGFFIGFQMVFPWFSHGFPWFFRWFPRAGSSNFPRWTASEARRSSKGQSLCASLRGSFWKLPRVFGSSDRLVGRVSRIPFF